MENKIEYKKLILDYESIAKQFPKAVEKMEDYFSRREDIMEGFKAGYGYDPGASSKELTHFVGLIIQFDCRRILDCFDYYGIFANVVRADGHWTYFVTDSPHSHSAGDRIDAEKAVLLEAFEILNKL